MKLAAIQYRPPKGEPTKARADSVAAVQEAGEAGAHLVVAPEMATAGYVWGSATELMPHAEERTGPTFHALAEQAARYGMWVVCGFPEREGGALYNSALLINPLGELASCYRKILLFEADQLWARPGSERPVLETALGRMTPGICMDLNDDLFNLHLRTTRPDIVPFCTNWVEQGVDILPYWRWRLMGWQGWFVAADCWGVDEHITFYGRSAILGPDGRVAAIAPPEGDLLLVAET